ncbi:MAG TPA: methyltransferase domain-containing protein [Lunatimonas sp.]|nr:methyltransferase domain-containing protein [Lunatimonas sp.]
MKKSTVEDIRKRFDEDVERFSQLETGQQAVIDAPLMMELITDAAYKTMPKARRVLDIGCGAGNQTLKLLSRLPDLNCDLLDLSGPMLKRAYERVSNQTSGLVRTFQTDIRHADLQSDAYDILLAGAVLHHLRDDEDWILTFAKLFELLKPGGSLWISDMVHHDDPAIHELMWKRYGEYLTQLGGEDYKDKVFSYIAIEDSPRSLTYQVNLLQDVGFKQVEILHKNSCFAAFGAIK